MGFTVLPQGCAYCLKGVRIASRWRGLPFALKWEGCACYLTDKMFTNTRMCTQERRVAGERATVQRWEWLPPRGRPSVRLPQQLGEWKETDKGRGGFIDRKERSYRERDKGIEK